MCQQRPVLATHRHDCLWQVQLPKIQAENARFGCCLLLLVVACETALSEAWKFGSRNQIGKTYVIKAPSLAQMTHTSNMYVISRISWKHLLILHLSISWSDHIQHLFRIVLSSIHCIRLILILIHFVLLLVELRFQKTNNFCWCQKEHPKKDTNKNTHRWCCHRPHNSRPFAALGLAPTVRGGPTWVDSTPPFLKDLFGLNPFGSFWILLDPLVAPFGHVKFVGYKYKMHWTNIK